MADYLKTGHSLCIKLVDLSLIISKENKGLVLCTMLALKGYFFSVLENTCNTLLTLLKLYGIIVL